MCVQHPLSKFERYRGIESIVLLAPSKTFRKSKSYFRVRGEAGTSVTEADVTWLDAGVSCRSGWLQLAPPNVRSTSVQYQFA